MHAWHALLIDEWHTAAKQLKLAKIPDLRLPNFQISPDATQRYGSWQADRRLITLNESLFLRYPRASIIEVLRHEIAHQVVSEALQLDHQAKPHGTEWKSVCAILGCRASATSCDDILEQQLIPEESAVLARVRKLMNHGQNAGATQAEAETFLAKARALLLKHQLDLDDLQDANLDARTYVQRPIGRLFKRLPGYYHYLGNLLSEHYLVHYIQVWHRIYRGEEIRQLSGIELFGEPNNIDVAEYVAHQLLVQAEMSWMRIRPTLRDANKRAFFTGLFLGYSEHLRTQNVDLEAQAHELILRESAHREHAFRQNYKIRNSSVRGGGGQSHEAGFEHGKTLNLPAGLRRGHDAGPKRLGG